MRKNIKYWCFLVVLICFAGCSKNDDKDTSDIKNFISALEKQKVTNPDENKIIRLHEPPPKVDGKISSPFPEQVAVLIDTTHMPLERYPLNALNLVGIVQQGKSLFAVIIAPDKKMYTIHVGDHIGSEGGTVTMISDQKMLVVESDNSVSGLPTEKTVVLRLKGSPDT